MFNRNKSSVPSHQIKRFTPFRDLADDQLILLANQAKLITIKKGSKLIKRGKNSKLDYYLLEGKVSIVDKSGSSMPIEKNSPSALLPIAKIRPSLYDVVADENSSFLEIDASLTDSALKESTASGSYQEADLKHIEAAKDQKLFKELYQQLKTNKLRLPSIPSVAFKIRELIDSGKCSTKELTNALNMDPAMAAKVLKAANSPLYRGANEIESVNQAVVRLGMNIIRQLVLSFATREIFRIKHPKLSKVMEATWEHSVEIAGISYMLAKKLKLMDPEEALLAGLLHDIGAIPIIITAMEKEHLLEKEGELDYAINALQAELGAAMLDHWHFPKQMVAAAQDAENWLRTSETKDVCDVVIIAQIHAFNNTERSEQLPAMQELPSFERLGLNTIDEKKLTKTLEQGLAHSTEIKAMLSS